MELQRGVCGDLASIEPLRAAVVERGVEVAAGRLVTAARSARLPVVHCTFELPADRREVDMSSPLLDAARDDPGYMLAGSPSAELLPALGPAPDDLIASRHHGLSPFGGTDLASRLAALGVDHVVVCGVSLNVGVPGLVIEACNHGFAVTVASDAVVGIPVSYGDDVVRHSLRFVATIATVDEITTSWTD